MLIAKKPIEPIVIVRRSGRGRPREFFICSGNHRAAAAYICKCTITAVVVERVEELDKICEGRAARFKSVLDLETECCEEAERGQYLSGGWEEYLRMITDSDAVSYEESRCNQASQCAVAINENVQLAKRVPDLVSGLENSDSSRPKEDVHEFVRKPEADSVSPGWAAIRLFQQKFKEACDLVRHSDNQLLDRLLVSWTQPSDLCQPVNDTSYCLFASNTLSSIVNMSFKDVRKQISNNATFIGAAVQLLERAQSEVLAGEQPPSQQHAPNSPHAAEFGSPKEFKRSGVTVSSQSNELETRASPMSAENWHECLQRIVDYGFGNERLGRLTPSLKDIPHVLWRQTFARFNELSESGLGNLVGQVPGTVEVLKRLFVAVARHLPRIGSSGFLEVNLSTPPIADARRLALAALSSVDPIQVARHAREMVDRVVDQLEIDTEKRVVEVMRAKMGIASPLTLDQVAQDFNLSQKQVHQMLMRGEETLEMRWPEGPELLSVVALRYNKCAGP